MPQNLKLTGLKSYTNAVTGAIIVKKGEVVRFSDDIAEKVLQGSRLNADHDPIPYWQPAGEDEKPKYDFSGPEKDEDMAVDANVIAAAKVVTSQRRRATA